MLSPVTYSSWPATKATPTHPLQERNKANKCQEMATSFLIYQTSLGIQKFRLIPIIGLGWFSHMNTLCHVPETPLLNVISVIIQDLHRLLIHIPLTPLGIHTPRH